MVNPTFGPWVTGLLLLGLAGCGDLAVLPASAGFGPDPVLPPPHQTLIPTVHIAPAKGWPSGTTPVAAAGLAVNAYAAGLEHPRWLYVFRTATCSSPRPTRPSDPDDVPGLKGLFMRLVMKRAGAAVPSATASRCCAMPTGTASRRLAPSSSTGLIRRSAWRWSE